MWEVERTGGMDYDPDLYHVVHTGTKERHTFSTYKSAYFIQQLFNDQERWYNYDRHGYSTTISTFDAYGSIIGTNTYSFHSSPAANWRMDFGDESNTYFTMYLKKGPGWFRRKMFRAILGITWSKL